MWRGVPVVLLGGSSLRMATPPSTRAPYRGRHKPRIGRASIVPPEVGASRRGRPVSPSMAGQVPCRGMDLTYPLEAEEFRGVISAWLAEHLPAGWGTAEFS